MMKNNSTVFRKFFSKTSRTALRLLSALALVVFSSSVLAQSPVTIKYNQTAGNGVTPGSNGSGTFTVPNCVTSITVQAWGGGGGGGYRQLPGSSGGYGSAGGGGGSYETLTLSVNPGEIIQYEIGKGGSGGSDGTATGGAWTNIKNGKYTILKKANGTTLSAAGGNGALDDTVTNSGNFGLGGKKNTANGYAGGKGGNAGKVNGTDYGGGGGGAGYPGATGGNGGNGPGGASSTGNNFGGAGGAGGVNTSTAVPKAPGSPGIQFGGGGGGSLKFSTSTSAANSPLGGDGAHGGIIITYTTNTPPSITSQPSTIGQNLCFNARATALSVTASAGSGTIEKYEWYSNTTASNTGGTLVKTNTVSSSPNTYTPSTATVGTLYYYVVVTNTNKCTVVSTVSGPVTVNANNTVGTASSSPTLCINTAMTSITHATTGATGIGTTTNNYGLPVGVTASWAESKITISGTPTIAGDYTYTIPLIGGCGSAFATGKITVNPAATAGPASSTPIVCINTTTVNITHTTTGATGIGSISGLPTGVNATWEANKITITGKPTVSGTFNYSIGLIGCGTGTATGTITVNANTTVSPATSSPTVCKNTPMTPITHITTGATGIGSQNGLPPGITATWLAGVITISGTPTTAGTFNYSILLSGGCGFVLAQGTINVGAGVPTTYTNGSWSNGEPDFSKRAIFATNYNTTTINTTIKNIQACTCEVQTGATLTIGAESNAVIQNDIINNGNIIVESDGNLIQKSDSGTYTGFTLNFTVKRNADRVKRLDYIYWSSPVKDQKMKPFSPGTVNSRFYIYNEIDNTFSSAGNPVTTSFAAAKGYAIRADNGYPNWTTFPIPESAYRDFVGIFKGEPHNGTFTYDLEKEGLGYNLVGNPYPSNVDFYSLVATGAIEGTAYFWTNVVPTPNTQLGSAYDGSNYSTFSVLSGGVPASNSGLSKAPEQYIKVGQGFIVQAKSAGQLNFRNDMRDDGTGSSRFISRGPTAEIDRFWLKLTTPEQNFNTILLAYPQGATNDYESTADAKQFGESADSFYSVLNDLKLNIQGRQFPLSNIDIVPIGMKGNIGGQYNIEMIKKEGIFEKGQNVYLKDNQTGIVTNLSEGSYTFAANKGVSEGRFDIVYQSETVLATDATLKEELVVYRDGNDFIVKAQSKKITGIEVFDATGRLVFKKLYNNTNVVVPSDQLSNGMYILKISQGEQTTTKKILR